MESLLFEFLLPVTIVVVLPVVIVYLVTRVRWNETDRKAEILIKAIESGVISDADFLKDRGLGKTPEERQSSRLGWGIFLVMIGAALLVVTWVGLSHFTFWDPIKLIAFASGCLLMAIGAALLIIFVCVSQSSSGDKK